MFFCQLNSLQLLAFSVVVIFSSLADLFSDFGSACLFFILIYLQNSFFLPWNGWDFARDSMAFHYDSSCAWSKLPFRIETLFS
jgi:hypothetical protein